MIYRTNSIRVINNFININEDKIIESFFENTAYNVMNEANFIENIKTAAKNFWKWIKEKVKSFFNILNEKIFSKIRANTFKRKQENKEITSSTTITNDEVIITIDMDKIPKILLQNDQYIKDAFESINIDPISKDMSAEEYNNYLSNMFKTFIEKLLPGINIPNKASDEEISNLIKEYLEDIKIIDENGNIKEKYVKRISIKDTSDLKKAQEYKNSCNERLAELVKKSINQSNLIIYKLNDLETKTNAIYTELKNNEVINNIQDRHEDFFKVLNKSNSEMLKRNQECAKLLAELDKEFNNLNNDINELVKDKNDTANNPKNESGIFSNINFI